MISEKTPRLLSPITEQRRQRPKGSLQPNLKLPLRQQVHEVMRFFHYSERTEATYWLGSGRDGGGKLRIAPDLRANGSKRKRQGAFQYPGSFNPR